MEGLISTVIECLEYMCVGQSYGESLFKSFKHRMALIRKCQGVPLQVNFENVGQCLDEHVQKAVVVLRSSDHVDWSLEVVM